MLSHIISNSGVTVVFDDGPKMLHKNAPGYQEAIEAIKLNNITKLRELMDPKWAIMRYSNNELSFETDGSISFEGLRLGTKFTSLLKSSMSRHLPWHVLAKFLTNCLANPSLRAQKEVEHMLEHDGLPITEDGCFLAYKLATVDNLDSDTGLFDCSIGKVVEMPRDRIIKNVRRGAERGFSAGGKPYLNTAFAGKVIIVKINPADLVGIYTLPYTEAVVCKFTVLCESCLDFSSDIVDSTTLEPLKQVE